MGMFNLYRSKVSCESTEKELALCETKQMVIADFLAHPNHEDVYKNFIPETIYDVVIHSGDAKDNTVPYKQLLSYPYDTPMFSIGDYIHWTYGLENTIWLLLACDKQYSFSTGGRIYQCNQTLKWNDSNGYLREYPVYMEDKLNETQPDYSKILSLPIGTVFIYMKYDDVSKEIKENRRFLIGNRGEYAAYKVQGIMSFSDENLVRFTLYRDQVDLVADDLVNGIANAYSINYTLELDTSDFEQVVGYTAQLDYSIKLNDNIVTRDVVWTSSDELIGTVDSLGNIELLGLGDVTFTCSMADNSNVFDSVVVSAVVAPTGIVEVRFEPNKTSILSSEGDVEYTVYKYIDDVIQSDGFSFALSGASSSSYIYINIDTNTFSIESIGLDYTKLQVVATSLIDSSVGTIQIQLKNLF